MSIERKAYCGNFNAEIIGKIHQTARKKRMPRITVIG